MKTLLKITRSIITSFLFIVLSVLIIVQFLFTVLRVQNIKLSEHINRNTILNIILEDNKLKENKQAKELALNYIDDYINYVFYKRSYPSLITTKLDIEQEEEKKEIIKELDTLRNKLDLKYETVLQIRKVNNFISNGSIYLIINVLLFTILLVIVIIKFNIKDSIRLLSISLLLNSVVLLVGGCLIYTKIINNENYVFKLLFKEILSNQFISSYFNQVLIYMSVGFVLLICTFRHKKLNRK